MKHLGVSRMARAGVALLVCAGLVVGFAPTAVGDPPAGGDLEDVTIAAPGRYIVTLKDQPVASYDGSVAGLPATRPEDGQKVSTTSAASERYQDYLDRQQTDVAREAGVEVDRSFSVSLNGFTSTLTPTEVRDLQRQPEVLSVVKDTFRQAADDRNSVDYLRLSGRHGLWSKLGGTDRAGAGVVVGVIDSGIWPESASFAGDQLQRRRAPRRDPYRPYLDGDKITMTKSDGSTFVGHCSEGTDWSIAKCNTKLIGARYFGKAFLAAYPNTTKTDFESPRDGEGHGTHVASTAAGNAGVNASIDGRSYGTVSGVAPAAKIASYKALWKGPTAAESGAFSSDLVDAIEAAVTDGVDVINYSIGGTAESAHDDPVALAFLSAASAGIFVAAAGGNSGPTPSTLDNTAPWVTTVAASTVAPYEATVRLGDGSAYLGVSTTVTAAVGSAPLALGSAVGTSVCAKNTLSDEKTVGKIIVCLRGGVDRTEKSAEVKRAGGLGMVLVNPTTNTLDADSHSVPSVIINPPASAAVLAYAATSGATATLVPGNETDESISYPQIAASSSRGPSTVSKGDLLKPDIAAPGVAILAAVAPPSNSGRSFDFQSGTSMASPHVAGVAAIYFGEHPRWSPMAVKSALMTTARDLVDSDGNPVADPYAQGAGELRPRRVLQPGLVYRSSPRDWYAYLEGLKVDTHTGIAPVDPSDLNTPSIAIGSLLGSQTVTRRVTAVKPGRYRAEIDVPGLRARVSPSVLRFTRKNQTKTFTVTFTRRSAPLGQVTTGFLTWRGRRAAVRSPIAITPQVVSAPDAIAGRGASGSIPYTLTPGVSGVFPITTYKFDQVEPTAKKLATGSQAAFRLSAGAKAARVAVSSSSATADFDLYLYRILDTGAVQVAASAHAGTSTETLTVPLSETGTYAALVYAAAGADPPATNPYTIGYAVASSANTLGSLTVTPSTPTARAGRPIQVTARWSGLSADAAYLGWIEYPGGSGTVVSIN